jgi:peptidoglycan/LPS O-acetylase OafA/YrhL
VSGTTPARHIAGLDLIRLAAALLVLSFHLGFYLWTGADSTAAAILDRPEISYPELAPFTWFGFIGVEIFFVISGFVIAASAAQSDARRFLAGRLLRLYPTSILFATIGVLIALSLGTYDDTAARFLRSLLLWPTGPWIDGAFWTLGVEMLFYAAVALLLAADGPRRLETLGLVIGLVSTLQHLLDHFDIGMDYLPSKLLLLEHGTHFAVGMTLQAIMVRGATLRRIVALFLFAGGGLLEIDPVAADRAAMAHLESWAVLPGLLYLGAIVLMAWSAAAPGGPIRQRIARPIGLMTYPLYLAHNLSGAAMMRAALAAGLGRYEALAVGAGGAVLVAFLVSTLVEPRLKAFALRLFAGETAGETGRRAAE